MDARESVAIRNQRQIYLLFTAFFPVRFFGAFRFLAMDFQLAAPARKLFLARLYNFRVAAAVLLLTARENVSISWAASSALAAAVPSVEPMVRATSTRAGAPATASLDRPEPFFNSFLAGISLLQACQEWRY